MSPHDIETDMSTRRLVDPEILPLIDSLPALDYSDAAMPMIREAFAAMEPETPPLPDGVRQDEIMIPGRPEEPDVRCLRFTPDGASAGTLVQFHGGGMIMGRPEHVAAKNAQLCAEFGLTVLAPAYRLSPEHRAPAAVMDGLATLIFAAETTPLHRLIVSGDSAGGLMAVSTVAAAREYLPGPIKGLHLVYPMLDPKTGGPDGEEIPTTGEFVWRRQSNRYAWGAYLHGAEPTSAYVPAALETLEGFPPTWIGTGALDLFLRENLDFAARLVAHGVSVDMTVYPGAPHAFPVVAQASVSQRFERDYREALKRLLAT